MTWVETYSLRIARIVSVIVCKHLRLRSNSRRLCISCVIVRVCFSVNICPTPSTKFPQHEDPSKFAAFLCAHCSLLKPEEFASILLHESRRKSFAAEGFLRKVTSKNSGLLQAHADEVCIGECGFCCRFWTRFRIDDVHHFHRGE